jgi:hypothetical protein
MDDVEKVRQTLISLDELGDGRAVGYFLADKGVRGIPRVHAHCPLANYLKRELGLNEFIDETTILVWPLETKVSGVKVKNPPAVVEFVQMLDELKFRGVLWPCWLLAVQRPAVKKKLEVAEEGEQAPVPLLV